MPLMERLRTRTMGEITAKLAVLAAVVVQIQAQSYLNGDVEPITTVLHQDGPSGRTTYQLDLLLGSRGRHCH